MDPALKKQIKIKTGSVQRLAKEKGLYAKEIEQLEAKKARFIAENAEEWDIKNAGKLIEESKKMVKDTTDRLAEAADSLRSLVAAAKENTEFAEDEDLRKAADLLDTLNP